MPDLTRDVPPFLLRCQACGLVAPTVACECTDEDRRIAIEAEQAAFDRAKKEAFARMTPEQRKKYAEAAVRPGRIKRIEI